ncbi:MAG: hypothetical protein IKV45_04750 [Firmicutes bacterium]|nr:hypothetical protein [Bacillota bacterium]
MITWMIGIVAIISTVICLFLWFRDVRRIMRDRKSTVESAAGQLKACRERACCNEQDLSAAEVLARSESIYQQAVAIYDRTLRKPGILLPAFLMGFRFIS